MISINDLPIILSLSFGLFTYTQKISPSNQVRPKEKVVNSINSPLVEERYPDKPLPIRKPINHESKLEVVALRGKLENLEKSLRNLKAELSVDDSDDPDLKLNLAKTIIEIKENNIDSILMERRKLYEIFYTDRGIEKLLAIDKKILTSESYQRKTIHAYANHFSQQELRLLIFNETDPVRLRVSRVLDKIGDIMYE